MVHVKENPAFSLEVLICVCIDALKKLNSFHYLFAAMSLPSLVFYLRCCAIERASFCSSWLTIKIRLSILLSSISEIGCAFWSVVIALLQPKTRMILVRADSEAQNRSAVAESRIGETANKESGKGAASVSI